MAETHTHVHAQTHTDAHTHTVSVSHLFGICQILFSVLICCQTNCSPAELGAAAGSSGLQHSLRRSVSSHVHLIVIFSCGLHTCTQTPLLVSWRLVASGWAAAMCLRVATGDQRARIYDWLNCTFAIDTRHTCIEVSHDSTLSLKKIYIYTICMFWNHCSLNFILFFSQCWKCKWSFFLPNGRGFSFITDVSNIWTSNSCIYLLVDVTSLMIMSITFNYFFYSGNIIFKLDWLTNRSLNGAEQLNRDPRPSRRGKLSVKMFQMLQW